MSSLCQNIKSSYVHLRKLTADFTAKYSDAKDSGDLREVRRLRKEIEAARDTLIDQIIIVTVPDAKNPYHEALLESGLDPAETQERQEITVDIREEIQRQLAVYRDTRDASRNPCLEEWVKDITDNERAMYIAIAKDRDKIAERIKEGMIPVVMPGRSVQMKTWEVALTKLKPIWVKNGTKRTVEDARLDEEFKKDITKKMTDEGFFKDIPDRPYLVWVKPTQGPDPDTINKSFDDQQAFHKTLLEKSPNLYDRTDLIPTEYMALQAIFTLSIQERFQERTEGVSKSTYIKPLDFEAETDTRFLSAGTSSTGHAPAAFFSSNSEQVCSCHDHQEASGSAGFRPASRT